MSDRQRDPRAWIIWTAAAAVVAMLARNPLYTILLLLAVSLVKAVYDEEGRGLELPLRRIGLLVIALSTLFNALFVHVGANVLFRLPEAWPLVGGPVTLEGAAYGATNGLVLLALLAIFLAFNSIVPVRELVRLTPRAFQDLGVVVLVAMTYVPETRRHLQQIQEAQAIRGHRLRGLRDWQPIVIPLLVGGLERAVNLAEAMVARGYGATADREQPAWMRAGMIVGLGAALGGWLVAVWVSPAGWLLLSSAVAFVLALAWRGNQRVQRTHYERRQWRRRDTLLLLAAALPLLGILVAPSPLAYTPYPALSPPPFEPLVGVALAALALPAFAASGAPAGGKSSGRGADDD